MSQKHTPGPWNIEQSAELLDDENLGLADITAQTPDSEYKTEVARVYCENRKGATVGPNARLIASAPELLEALEIAEVILDSVAFVSEDGDTEKPLKIIRAAIAKAKGKTNAE